MLNHGRDWNPYNRFRSQGEKYLLHLKFGGVFSIRLLVPFQALDSFIERLSFMEELSLCFICHSYIIIWLKINTMISIGFVVGPFDRMHSPGHLCVRLLWYRNADPAALYFPSRDSRRLPFIKYLPSDIRNARVKHVEF